jgi:vancomycin resistance protein VanJ
MIKRLSFMGKLFYFANIVFGLLLLISYFIPMIHPGSIPFVATLSLIMPLLISINVFFTVFWILKGNIRFIFSLLVLALGFHHLNNLYRLSNTEYQGNSDLSVMTFNVRMFNVFSWIDRSGVDSEIYELVKANSPDIVAFQEYHPMKNFDIGDYQYDYYYFSRDTKYWGQAIFSKYKIIDSGIVEFPSSVNSAVFIDVDVNGITTRVYSVHLETLRLSSQDLEIFQQFNPANDSTDIGKNVKDLASKIDAGFGRHGEQADLLRSHIDKSPYPVVVMGDFNSSAFSYEYNVIKGNLNDAFTEGGNGFGTTYDFPYWPLRIDFILSDQNYRLIEFKTLNEKKLSDHYPVFASYKIR